MRISLVPAKSRVGSAGEPANRIVAYQKGVISLLAIFVKSAHIAAYDRTTDRWRTAGAFRPRPAR
jgi:hypothetical protein